MDDILERVRDTWHPASRSLSRTVGAGPVGALADLFDQEVALEQGSPVPLLWHWATFTESCPQAALGPDGHPAEGHFLPPFPDRRRMMAGGRVRQVEPLRIGATYLRKSELAAAAVKHGRSGDMLFTTVRYTFRLADGPVVMVEEEDVVYRQQAPGEARRLAPPEEESCSWWHLPLGRQARLTVTPDSRMLFRFSALTYNTHRIHYDADYATGVEGYPGLVVHGPLLALLMLELPRRAGAQVARFDYRLSRPAFAGDGLVATWDGDDLRAGMASASTPSSSATLTV